MISAGELDQRLTLQQRSTGVDLLGQESQSWSTVATVWAQAQPLRGRELFAAGQAQTEAEVRFRIRYRDDIEPTMRAVWRSRAHDILSVADVDGGHEVTELLCTTGARDGRAIVATGSDPVTYVEPGYVEPGYVE
jgi:SPP1 family predicted phage head-tail adaptor